MRMFILRVTAIGLVALSLIQFLDSESRTTETSELEASLFDNGSLRHANAAIHMNASSLDVKPAVDRWTRGDQVLDGIGSLVSLVSFNSVAYAQAQPPTSAASGTGGPVGCSASGASTAQTLSCSTNQDSGAVDGYGSWCSTAAAGPAGTGTAVCSAYEPPTPPVGVGSDNTPCSAAGNGSSIPGAVNYCSAGGTTGAVGCSTAGGQNNGTNSDGAVVCSATGAVVSGNSCSATAGGASITCSTNAGQHQACSAGQTSGTNSASCSATGTSTGGATAMCSVSASATSGGHNNKCSAVAYNPPLPPGGTDSSSANCSTSGTTNATCSVAAGNTGGENNTACTVIPFGSNTPPAGYACSATAGAAANSCSVIQADGTATGPTGTPPTCGGPIHGH